MRRADVKTKQYNGTIVLQGNGVARQNEVLQKLEQEGLNLNVFMLRALVVQTFPRKQETIFPKH